MAYHRLYQQSYAGFRQILTKLSHGSKARFNALLHECGSSAARTRIMRADTKPVVFGWLERMGKKINIVLSPGKRPETMFFMAMKPAKPNRQIRVRTASIKMTGARGEPNTTELVIKVPNSHPCLPVLDGISTRLGMSRDMLATLVLLSSTEEIARVIVGRAIDHG